MKSGKINVTWSKTDYQDLDYENIKYEDQFSIIDENDFSRYNVSMAYVRGRFLGEKFGVTDQFDWLNDVSYAVHNISSGQILPYHRDQYARYKKIYNIDDSMKIERIILFLEDWSPGHILGIGDRIISNWEAGDWVSWRGQTVHMAANLGQFNRYTLQITGHSTA